MKNILLALLVAFFGMEFMACSKSDDDKGPMEKAGRAVDQAVEQAKEKAGQAMEKTGEAIKEAGEKLKEAGEKSKQ